MCSCSKSGPALFHGYYSFKTGGHLEISGKIQDGEESRDTTFTRYITSESGQMRILDAGDGRMKVTMNISGGGNCVYDAYEKDNSLILEPTERRVGIIPGSNASEQSIAFLLTTKGSGKRFGKTIILDMVYEGKYSYHGLDGNISASHINCIATENE